MKIQEGEYFEKGNYHRILNKNWPYYPIYIAKMEFIRNYLLNFDKNKKILDAGCGEGILVEEFRNKGYDIIGLDLTYESNFVIKADITNTDLVSNSFNLILCLDVIEHLNFDEQEKAIMEIFRILKNKGILLISIPNLAHFASRLSFLLTGELLRTSNITRHKGDRPIKEYIRLLKKYFHIIERKGIFPTFPISSILTYKFPSKVIYLHKFLNKYFAYANWCFLNMVICKKKI